MFLSELQREEEPERPAPAPGAADGAALPRPDWSPVPGERVRHSVFGNGAVEKVSPDGRHVTLRFASGQPKTFDVETLCRNKLLRLLP